MFVIVVPCGETIPIKVEPLWKKEGPSVLILYSNMFARPMLYYCLESLCKEWQKDCQGRLSSWRMWSNILQQQGWQDLALVIVRIGVVSEVWLQHITDSYTQSFVATFQKTRENINWTDNQLLIWTRKTSLLSFCPALAKWQLLTVVAGACACAYILYFRVTQGLSQMWQYIPLFHLYFLMNLVIR